VDHRGPKPLGFLDAQQWPIAVKHYKKCSDNRMRIYDKLPVQIFWTASLIIIYVSSGSKAFVGLGLGIEMMDGGLAA